MQGARGGHAGPAGQPSASQIAQPGPSADASPDEGQRRLSDSSEASGPSKTVCFALPLNLWLELLSVTRLGIVLMLSPPPPPPLPLRGWCGHLLVLLPLYGGWSEPA